MTNLIFDNRITIEIAENDTVDVNTWKLCILQCLQQLKGVLGQSIEFDIMTSEEIKGTETIVRVHYNDRVVFSQCVAAGTFTSHNGTGDASIQIVAQSAFLQGIMVPNSV